MASQGATSRLSASGRASANGQHKPVLSTGHTTMTATMTKTMLSPQGIGINEKLNRTMDQNTAFLVSGNNQGSAIRSAKHSAADLQ